jgi:hypothetical protein
MKKMGEVIHTIEVPAKFAKHRDHYIKGFMKGYLGAADRHAAKRALEGASAQLGAAPSRKKASHEAAFEKRESRVQQKLRKGV